MKRIAIIGTGISGLTTAHYLKKEFDITMFEANSYIGGHTNTITVNENGNELHIDTGFIVFNDWTYPHFIQLMNELGVESQPSDMSFSVKCDRTGLEYNGTNTNSLFAQRRNLFRPKFWKMLFDIIRFNREGTQWLETASNEDDTALGEFIEKNRYSSDFKNYYALPITAAVWSASRDSVLNFPLRFYLQFFKNHGFLNVNDRPQWRVIKGGSNSYIPWITKGLEDRINLNSPVRQVIRGEDSIQVVTKNKTNSFDAVVFACHSDQALKMIQSPTENETAILSALPYQKNRAVLHTDHTVLPKKKLAHAAWNYHLNGEIGTTASLTYNMNILQRLESQTSYNVSLNYENIDPATIIKEIEYHHPVFTLEGVEAQKRHHEISGHNRTFYAGAYWRYGFHEDGVISGIRAAEQVKELFGHE